MASKLQSLVLISITHTHTHLGALTNPSPHALYYKTPKPPPPNVTQLKTCNNPGVINPFSFIPCEDNSIHIMDDNNFPPFIRLNQVRILNFSQHALVWHARMGPELEGREKEWPGREIKRVCPEISGGGTEIGSAVLNIFSHFRTGFWPVRTFATPMQQTMQHNEHVCTSPRRILIRICYCICVSVLAK